jgi:hypothetical protein
MAENVPALTSLSSGETVYSTMVDVDCEEVRPWIGA